MACGLPLARPPSWLSKSDSTLSNLGSLSWPCEDWAALRNAASVGNWAWLSSLADWRLGMTPNAWANASCWSLAVMASTNLTAASLYLLLAAMPQHWVNERVPWVPDGPVGSGWMV